MTAAHHLIFFFSFLPRIYDKTYQNRNKQILFQTIHGRTGARYESLIQSRSQQEYINFWEVTYEEEKFWRRMWVSSIHRLWNITGSFMRWPCTWIYCTMARICQINIKAVLIMVIDAVVAKCINMTNACIHDLTHWHTQTSLRRLGSLGPLIHSRLWDAIQRPTQHYSTTGVCIEVNKN